MQLTFNDLPATPGEKQLSDDHPNPLAEFLINLELGRIPNTPLVQDEVVHPLEEEEVKERDTEWFGPTVATGLLSRYTNRAAKTSLFLVNPTILMLIFFFFLLKRCTYV